MSRCDCTANCGDDPAINRGTVTPCTEYLTRQARKQRERDARALRKELGITDELDALTRLQQLITGSTT